jgi:hypothetical protein
MYKILYIAGVQIKQIICGECQAGISRFVVAYSRCPDFVVSEDWKLSLKPDIQVQQQLTM